MSTANDDIKQAGHAVRRVSLAQMRPGETGTIVEVSGGYGLFRKLDALGIRVGREITKVSGQWMRGPVLMRQNNIQAALGFGMACRVIVELPSDGGDG